MTSGAIGCREGTSCSVGRLVCATRTPHIQRKEPLRTFKCGAIVHLAVSDSDIRMTTKLAGADMFFLPFNLGWDGRSGNAINTWGDLDGRPSSTDPSRSKRSIARTAGAGRVGIRTSRPMRTLLSRP
jgi:hypothetical protein